MSKEKWTTLEILILAGIFALLFIVAAGAHGQPLPRPQCTDSGWYRRSCDGNWNFAIPGNMTGHTFQGCGAHTLYVYDEDGAQYAIINQCYAFSGCTGTMGTYKKPDHPGKALTLWNNYYVGPDAAQQRALYPYVNPSFSVPTGVQHYDFLTLAQVPEPWRSNLGRAYGCTGLTPVPTAPVPPTRTAAPATPIRTATRQPTTASGCCREGIDCLPGAPIIRCTPTPCTGGPSCTTRTRTFTPIVAASATATPSISPGGCGAPSPDKSFLCLSNRFRVEATWTKPSGESGHATPTSCRITVTDTRTGAVKTYTNPQGVAFAPIQATLSCVP
jgi:hypothetical protein